MDTDIQTSAPPPAPEHAPTPREWRAAILAAVGLLGLAAWAAEDALGPRGRAAVGLVCFFGVAAAFSTNLRAVSWRTVGFGVLLQVLMALFVLRSDAGFRLFAAVGKGVGAFLGFSNEGARFVFGGLAEPAVLGKALGPENGFVFAFSALPTIIFVSSFFTVLYHFGVLQLVVKVFAVGMRSLMRTSGAETLSAVANVFMGQTEAPLIVKPYVARMTDSELLALMVGGMATISGGVMAVYIQMGADPVGILATSVMAAPCGLYLSKLLLPETGRPVTLGTGGQEEKSPHRNVIDAASAGASDGLSLALNIAAMLIAFLALLAMIDAGVQWASLRLGAVTPVGLKQIFGAVFGPAAYLMGVERADLRAVGDLLGTKLVANEFVAYVKLTGEYKGVVSERSLVLATFALTGFANFASIGIQLGGIGAMAPSRRADLARLGGLALFAGFLATLMNAALAAVLLP
ncbi:MAG: NupC/NupG family nucleoside CNT transporter [Gemmataceae bacterium]